MDMRSRRPRIKSNRYLIIPIDGPYTLVLDRGTKALIPCLSILEAGDRETKVLGMVQGENLKKMAKAMEKL